MLTTPSQTVEAIQLDDLYSVDDFAQLHSALTLASLRWQLRHKGTNGLAPACVRLGKKVLISKSRYEAWLATRAGVSA